MTADDFDDDEVMDGEPECRPCLLDRHGDCRVLGCLCACNHDFSDDSEDA